MVATYKYYLHGIQLPSGAWITELTDTTPAPKIDELIEYPAGAVAPTFTGAHGAKPEISFSTPQIKTVLDACGLTGLDASGGNVDLYYRRAVNRGTRGAIANGLHLRVRCLGALVYWTRLSARQGQNATIDCRVVPTFDGTNVPLVGLGGGAIPAITLASQFFGVGPVAINGATLPGLSGWSLDLGCTLDEEASDGEDFPSWAGVENHKPILTFTPRDLVYWGTVGVSGLAMTAAEFYLRKRAADSVRAVADGLPEHIKFSAVDNPCGILTLENSSGGHPKAAEISLKAAFRVSNVLTAYPLAVSTTSAIT